MSRKHFEALAKALKETYAANDIIDAIGAVCLDNCRNEFDWKKFRDAAGYDWFN